MRSMEERRTETPAAMPVDNIVRQDLSPGYHFRTHLHHTVELFICTGGEVTVTILGSEITVVPGEFFVYFPDIPHSITITGSVPFTALQMHYHSIPVTRADHEAPEAASAFALELSLGRRKYIKGCASSRLESCMEGVYEEMNAQRPGARRMIRLYLEQINVLLSRALIEADSSGAIYQNRYLLNASLFINENYMKKLTVLDVAQAAGISRRYLTKLFHENFDLGVCAYISHVRISKAIDFMYSNPNYPLTKLALDVGFSSQQHFSKVFKEKMTVSPKRYFSLQLNNT